MSALPPVAPVPTYKSLSNSNNGNDSGGNDQNQGLLIGPSLSQFCRLGRVEFRSATPMLRCACVVLRPPNWLATLTQTQLPLEL